MLRRMKRLTISADACTETLAVLIAMAWADGRFDVQEKDGVRAAASVLNLTKELRDRLDQVMEKPLSVDELLFDTLSSRDKAFAFVAAAWMSGVDGEVDPKEQMLLDKLAGTLGLTSERKRELVGVARDLEPLRKAKKSWTQELVALFKAIPQRLEGDGTESFEVAFE
jgi:tellurite resistance protein